jgi:hypothetical protein
MAGGTRTQALLREHPWALALVSGVFVLAIVVLAADVGWDPGAEIGGGRRHLPLWVVLLLGLPLFGAGVVLGLVRQVRGPRRGSEVTDAPSDDLRRLRADGPGWLSRQRGSAGDDVQPPHE